MCVLTWRSLSFQHVMLSRSLSCALQDHCVVGYTGPDGVIRNSGFGPGIGKPQRERETEERERAVCQKCSPPSAVFPPLTSLLLLCGLFFWSSVISRVLRRPFVTGPLFSGEKERERTESTTSKNKKVPSSSSSALPHG